MSWRKTTFIIAALIVLLGGSYALSIKFISMKPENKRRPEMDMKRFVKAEEVIYTQITSPLTSQGRVVSSNAVTLVSEASGKIQQGNVNLRKGTSFKKGQLLGLIYKDEVELALKARKSNFLTTMTTILPDIKVDYTDRYDNFMAFFNSIKMDKDLPILPEVKDEKLRIFLASRNIMSEYFSIQQDEKKLKRHYFIAPFDGTFTQVNFEVGGFVNIGAQIARMIRTDMLEVEVPVENLQSKWIKIGDQAKVFSSNGKSAKDGKVVRKSNFIDANTQSRSIFVRVSNSVQDELLAGEYKIVKFPGQIIDQAMEIPRKAVFNSNEVFVVVDGKLKKQEINVLKWNETTLLFDGIQTGQMIVTEPLINIKENSSVGIIGIDKPMSPKGKKGGKGKGEKQAKEKAKS